MNRLFMPFIVGMIIPTLMAQADVPLKQVSTFHLPVFNPPRINLPIAPSSLIKKSYTRIVSKAPIGKVPYDWYKDDLSASMLDQSLFQRHYLDFLSNVSPAYTVNRNVLGLTNIIQERKKKAIMFVFCMNKKKKAMSSEQRRTKIHIMWPGGRKRMREQILIEKEYPIDISIANFRDGYAPGEWNIVLPSKKPKEVRVSLLWSF